MVGPVMFYILAGTQLFIKFARMLLTLADVDELQFQISEGFLFRKRSAAMRAGFH